MYRDMHKWACSKYKTWIVKNMVCTRVIDSTAKGWETRAKSLVELGLAKREQPVTQQSEDISQEHIREQESFQQDLI